MGRRLASLPLRTKGLLVVAVPTMTALLLAGLLGFAHAKGSSTKAQVVDTYEVRLAIGAVLSDLVDAETGARGYALSHDRSFLEPYHDGLATLQSDIDRLRAIVDDDRSQLARVMTLRSLVTQRRALLSSVVEHASHGSAVPSWVLNAGKGVMDDVRVVLGDMDRAESAELAERKEAELHVDTLTRQLAFGGLLLALLGGAGGMWLFGAGISRRVLALRRGTEQLAHERPVEDVVTGSDEIGLAGRALLDAADLLFAKTTALREREQELALVIDRLAEGVVMAGADGRFRLFNAAAEDILGVGRLDVDQDRWSSEYHIMRTDGVTPMPSDELPLARALRGESTDGIEAIARTPHRGDTWLSISGRPIRDEAGAVTGGVVVFADVTQRKRFELQLQELARIDELTGLLNRRGFDEAAERELAFAARHLHPASVLFVDVDGLKSVNDRLGHAEGSRLIADVGHVLAGVARSSDVVGRLGGDEFCLLAVGDAHAAGIAIESRIQAGIDRLNGSTDRRYEASVSIGVARFDPTAPRPLDELIAEADERMYERKRQRRAAR